MKRSLGRGFLWKQCAVVTILGFLSLLAACQRWNDGSSIEPQQNFITFSKIDKAWQYGLGAGVKVAVCDCLFDMGPEASRKYVDAKSMVPGKPVGATKPWHGEWMAEIIHQTAPEAKIIPIMARPGGDNDYEPYLIAGIRYAADRGAAAVTCSMGPVHDTAELRAAVVYAEAKGTLFINVHPLSHGLRQIFDPIAQKILVTGLASVPRHPASPERGRDIYLWPYSLTPTFEDGWGYSNGPPITAGVVALMKSANPELTPGEIKGIIVATGTMRNGFRVLDAEAAVREAVRRKH